MMLQKINVLKLNEGTEDKPFVLSENEVKTLYDIALSGVSHKDIRGYYSTESGKIKAYQKYAIQKSFPYAIIDAEDIEEAWSVAATSNTIKEGESTDIIVSGIPFSSLSYRIGDVSVIVNSGVYGEENVRKSINISDKGILTYSPAFSNAGWTAIVKLEFYPSYVQNPSNDDLRVIQLTVTAIAITGIEIDAVDSVGLSGIAEVKARTIPTNNTKKDGVDFELSVSDGNLASGNVDGEATFIAPNYETEVTLTAKCFLFDEKDYPTYSKIHTIIVALPFLKVQVNTDGDTNDFIDAEFDVVPIINEEEGASIIVKNGDIINNVTIGTKYIIRSKRVKGYKKPKETEITITGAANTAYIDYYRRSSGFYVVYSDGSEVVYDGSVDANKTAVAMGFASTECSFMAPLVAPVNKSTFDNEHEPSSFIEGVFCSENVELASLDYGGENNTAAIEEYVKEYNLSASRVITSPIVDHCRSCKIVIDGEELTGYVGALGEVNLLMSNFGMWRAFCSKLGVNFNIVDYYNVMSSSFNNRNRIWVNNKNVSMTSLSVKSSQSAIIFLPF